MSDVAGRGLCSTSRPRRRRRIALGAVLLLLAAVGALAVVCFRNRVPWLPSEVLVTVPHREPDSAYSGLTALPGRTHVVLPANLYTGGPLVIVDAATAEVSQYELPGDVRGRAPASDDGSLWWLEYAHWVGSSSAGKWVTSEGFRELATGRTWDAGGIGSSLLRGGVCAWNPVQELMALSDVSQKGQPGIALFRGDGSLAKRLGRLSGPGEAEGWGVRRFDCKLEVARVPACGWGEWSPDGRRLLVRGADRRTVWVLEPGTGGTARLGLPLPGFVGRARWWGNDALLYDPDDSGGIAAMRVELPGPRTDVVLGGAEPNAPWPVCLATSGSVSIGWGQPVLSPLEVTAGSQVADASPDGRWFIMRLAWTNARSPLGRAAQWVALRAETWGPTARGALWIKRRILQDRTGYFVFDRNGHPRWRLPVRGGDRDGAAFLQDSRICWLDGDEVRVGDPAGGRRGPRATSPGATQRTPPP